MANQTLDYEAIGLVSGIEIHQQIDSHKLFCMCPSSIRDDPPHRIVKRMLRASAGERGEVDKAAKAEMDKHKQYIYEAYDDTTCLVELDEEPPGRMNLDALSVVLQISRLLNANVVDSVQVMRKTVVDGSNTSGFQRTALVAMEGWINVSGKRINIPTVCIEEDAAKIVEQGKDYTRYNLSKLGIPLVEICTGPDMRSPQQVQEVASYLGMVLRSTGRVKRGIGTIRQDINVSVRGGARIEIKGAQELRLIPLWVENEARRQIGLIEIMQILPKSIEIKEDFKDLKLTYEPEYSPYIRTGVAKKNTGTQIGKLSFHSRAELRDTIIHEELHHRWWKQGKINHHPNGSPFEKAFYEIIERYKIKRKWK